MSELVTKDDFKAALKLVVRRVTLMLGVMFLAVVFAVVAIRALP